MTSTNKMKVTSRQLQMDFNSFDEQDKDVVQLVVKALKEKILTSGLLKEGLDDFRAAGCVNFAKAVVFTAGGEIMSNEIVEKRFRIRSQEAIKNIQDMKPDFSLIKCEPDNLNYIYQSLTNKKELEK